MGKRLLGPSKPGIDRLKGLYIREFLVKVERKPGVMQDIKTEILNGLEALTAMKKFKSVTFRIDVDPA
jgi:primosomal protein N'